MATVINPFTAVDGNGNVRALAKLYFYQTGTTTLQNTYADAALSAVNTNPVVADSNGLFPATYLGDPPTFMAYKAILKTSADVTVWTTDPIAGAPITTPISAALLRSYLAGLAMTGRTNTTITYAAGVCAESTNTTMLSLSAGTINCATVGADGLDAGALANSTWYHAYAIGKTDGTTARLASTSASSPTLPSGYTLKRRIGSFKTNGSAQIVDFTQVGDDFFWKVTVQDINASAVGLTATTLAIGSVPTGIKVYAKMRINCVADATVRAIMFYSPEQDTQVVATPAGNGSMYVFANLANLAELTILTNTSAQIGAVANVSSVTVTVNTFGWVDSRGRDA